MVEDEVTVRSVVEAEIAEISEKREVEEAKRPAVALSMEEVAAVMTPKLVEKMNGSAAPAAVLSTSQPKRPLFQVRTLLFSQVERLAP